MRARRERTERMTLAFDVGQRVRHIPSGRVGVVVAVRRVAGGKTFVRVACDNGDVAIRPSGEWEEEKR